MQIKPKYAMYVDYADIPTYLELGWIAQRPTRFDHFNVYGIAMLWLCDCEPPYLRRPINDRDTQRYD